MQITNDLDEGQFIHDELRIYTNAAGRLVVVINRHGACLARITIAPEGQESHAELIVAEHLQKKPS